MSEDLIREEGMKDREPEGECETPSISSPSPLRKVILKLEREANSFEKLMELTTKRLSPFVCEKSCEKGEGSEKQPVPQMSQFVTRIDEGVKSIRSSRINLEKLLEKLEI